MNEMHMIDLKFQAARKAEARVLELQGQIEKLLASDDPAAISETDKLLDELHAATDIVVRAKQPGTRVTEPIRVDSRASFPTERTGQTTGHSEWRDLKSGKRIPVLSRGTKLSDLGGQPSGELSMGRLIRAMVRRDWNDAEAEKRAMSGGINTAGGWLVPNPLSNNVVDLARAKVALIEAGAGTLLMDSGTLLMARVMADPTILEVAESAAFGESQPTLGGYEITAQKWGTLVRASRELIADAPNSAQLLEDILSQALATKIDNVGLAALMSSADVNNGAAITSWDNVIDGIGLVQGDNHEPTSFVLHPTLNGTLAKLVGTANDHYITPPPMCAALKKIVTTQLNAAEALIGDFSKMLICIRREPEISVSEDAGFATDEVLIRCSWRGSVCITDPNAFAAMKA